MSLIESTEADETQSGEERSDSSSSLLGRRSYLKLSGVTLGSIVSVGTVSAASGYGAEGYGEGTFGGSTDSNSVAVSTESATEIAPDAATLNGSLDDLGSVSSADCYFEYRESNASSWNATAAKTITSPMTFSETISGLASGTDYEFRAVATASTTATGRNVSFTTDKDTSDGGNPPMCDSYRVTEAGSPNPHAEITADWSVSDTDGDLSSVVVQVIDSSGTVVDSSRTSVRGATGSGRDRFKIKKVSGATFDVILTVTDTAGNSASRTKTVTE